MRKGQGKTEPLEIPKYVRHHVAASNYPFTYVYCLLLHSRFQEQAGDWCDFSAALVYG